MDKLREGDPGALLSVRRKILFGHTEIENLEPRVDGDDLVLRARFTRVDGDGKREEEIVEGVRMVNGAIALGYKEPPMSPYERGVWHGLFGGTLVGGLIACAAILSR